jgi:hypothetical protein
MDDRKGKRDKKYKTSLTSLEEQQALMGKHINLENFVTLLKGTNDIQGKV